MYIVIGIITIIPIIVYYCVLLLYNHCFSKEV